MITAAEVRASRSFLRSKVGATTTDIPPRQFAMAAKELGIGFKELAKLLSRIYAA